jgi:hypothetical protein
VFKRLKKKGYYFVIDALIGATIIFLSLMIILNSGSRPTKVQYNYEMAEEYTSFIINTKMEDLNSELVLQMINDGRIKDTRHSIIEQVDEFDYKSMSSDATALVQNITEPLIPQKYGFSYTLIKGVTRTLIYSRASPDINNAKIVIASKKITFLQIDSSTMFGPALVEIKIWA